MTSLPYSSQIHAIVSLFAFILPTWSVDSSTIVFFDRFGDCWSEEFNVHAEPFTVNAQGSGEIYQIKRCELKFKTDPNEKLCLKVNRIDIKDCSVKLLAYGGKNANDDDTQLASYDCGSGASTVCSGTNYLTLVLHKRYISSINYDFQLKILQEKVGNKSKNGQGQGGIFVSLTVLVAIIVGVALLIAIVVFVIMYCWRRKRKHHGKVHRQKRKDARSGRDAEGTDQPSSGTPLQPSAPPHPDLDLISSQDPGFDSRRFLQSYPMEPPPPYELPSPKSQDVPPVRV